MTPSPASPTSSGNRASSIRLSKSPADRGSVSKVDPRSAIAAL
jgi:hypothetical protein